LNGNGHFKNDGNGNGNRNGNGNGNRNRNRNRHRNRNRNFNFIGASRQANFPIFPSTAARTDPLTTKECAISISLWNQRSPSRQAGIWRRTSS
jgi:hypothetical protein